MADVDGTGTALASGVATGTPSLVVGGTGSARGEGYAYAAGGFAPAAWTYKTNFPYGRESAHGFHLAPYNYIIGGYGSTAPNYVYRYDPALNSWTYLFSLPTTRYRCAFGVINGKAYLVAGNVNTTYEWTPGTTVVTTKAAAPTSIGAPYSGVHGGYLYFGDTTAFYRYDPVANTYLTLTPDAVAMNYSTGVFADGLFHVFGGSGSQLVHRIYDPVTDSWSDGLAMPAPGRFGHATVFRNGLIYVIGGYDTATGTLATVLSLDVALNTWTVRQSMPAGAHYIHHGAFDSPAGLYVVGGYNGGYLATHLFTAIRTEVDGGAVFAVGQGVAQSETPAVGVAAGEGVASGSGEVRFMAKQFHGGGLPVSGQVLLDYWEATSPPR